jgi:hypothetical protein
MTHNSGSECRENGDVYLRSFCSPSFETRPDRRPDVMAGPYDYFARAQPNIGCEKS